MLNAMAALGMFVFTLKSAPYQQMQRKTQWRHPSNARVGKRPARQFVGQGDDTLTLSGTLYPELTGGRVSLALLRTMADTGKAWPLIEGSGVFKGLYVIEDMDETATLFFGDGSPRRLDFSVQLSRVDDDDLEMLGAVTDAVLTLL